MTSVPEARRECRHCKSFSALVRGSSGNAVSRAEDEPERS